MFKSNSNAETLYYDLCCGSGAVTIELINQGVRPEQIIMLDSSSWGAFWQAIANKTFDLEFFQQLLSDLPEDKAAIKAHLTELSKAMPNEHEAEIYLLLQSGSFGGKQIWLSERGWQNAFFRDYWLPTKSSSRQSPANPLHPSPDELFRRTSVISQMMHGVNARRDDIFKIFDEAIPENAVVYVDPPYQSSTGYGFGFDLESFISKFLDKTSASLFVSEGHQIRDSSVKLSVSGSNGGISGNRKLRHEEWLTRF